MPLLVTFMLPVCSTQQMANRASSPASSFEQISQQEDDDISLLDQDEFEQFAGELVDDQVDTNQSGEGSTVRTGNVFSRLGPKPHPTRLSVVYPLVSIVMTYFFEEGVLRTCVRGDTRTGIRTFINRLDLQIRKGGYQCNSREYLMCVEALSRLYRVLLDGGNVTEDVLYTMIDDVVMSIVNS